MITTVLFGPVLIIVLYSSYHTLSDNSGNFCSQFKLRVRELKTLLVCIDLTWLKFNP